MTNGSSGKFYYKFYRNQPRSRTGMYHNIRIEMAASNSCDKMKRFRNDGKEYHYIQEEIKSVWNSGHTCYHSVQNLNTPVISSCKIYKLTARNGNGVLGKTALSNTLKGKTGLRDCGRSWTLHHTKCIHFWSSNSYTPLG
jgi:hypothetical protein